MPPLELLTAQEVAKLVRVHVVTFQRWCRAGEGPPVTMLGRRPRYRADDVQHWVESRRHCA